ncbi:nitrilase-related carbon-nitrogen hydrolase [Hippea maritima]|uniref:NAD(+) synthase (Glutamine-hydrolyzing) n=1 Tax=Hippea maritima (strain ATCC 700847 / DSM 10411 / MH2) TaxID=760142 RepID=F2LU49_HIPMA|nr:nitrilase-related carbon-nitrogen hydrolase [Hippea maritima]AEA34512.1 NAD(+) synthase (glutamine-hydrolyzing) [Hippea maritima DSM 10411]
MKIAIGQIDTVLGDVAKNTTKIEHYIDMAIDKDCDLIVFPELATSGYGLRDLVYQASISVNDKLIKSIATKSLDIDIVIGFAQEENGYYFNSAAYFSNGNLIHIHKKNFLPDYGMFEEERYFTKGTSIETFKTKFGNTTMLICEDAFHVSSHCKAFFNRTEVLIILSASPFWSDYKSMKWEMWENISKTYTQLNSSFVVFANRTGFEDGVGFFGKSFIASPHGSIIKQASFLKEELLITQIDPKDIKRAKIKMPILKNEDETWIKN